MRRAGLLAVALGLGVSGGASASPPPAHPGAALRMNDIQVVGSHNSFKARIPAEVMAQIRKRDARLADGLDYYHVPLAAQLDAGVRQLEIDIFADPKGGRYADPKGAKLVKATDKASGFDRPAMLKPGFKVLHIPDIDYRSTCATLVRCLGEVTAWSKAHPGHLPIMITLNAADTPQSHGVSDPLPLDDAALLDALDGEIRKAIPGKRLLTPDEVRGKDATLAGAVKGKGWPTLDAARGRIYVLFDVRPAVSEVYRTGHPSLRGRAMFGWYPDGEAESAVQIVQDPLVDGAKIRELVKSGVIVRTRTDANTVEARAHDFAKARAAVESGAQAVSTDYYPGAPDPLGLGFMVTLPQGEMARCNPVRVTGPCAVKP
ncbi:Ca2+-dependent phosphoinositide-specific phospholipase C [Novosphingobium kaempferiae]|uniref:Ca2+-dependent phosphoinositide-specific phospholipase C n=1 Tax=Novosphingobium kaempferiae TaxID=2896849 RepID=UPI001E5F3BDA|nr:Ca2+-dependent phosphoinositide-specific phospholipase C [Novosphingobium kaempferiae]